MRHSDDDFFSSDDDENKRKYYNKDSESWRNVYNPNDIKDGKYGFGLQRDFNKKTKSPASVITVLLGTAAGLLLVSFLIVLFSKFGSSSLSNPFAPSDSSENTGDPNGPSIEIHDRTGEESTLFTQIFEKCSPSIVGIECCFKNDENPFDQESVGWGSGIVISKEGYILTNAHVVQNSKETAVKIITKDKKEYTDATVVGYDESTDIAIIKVNGVSDLCPAEFGNSSQIKIGERVAAIGNPHGQNFQNSFTVGVISGLDRLLGSRNKFIQSDVAINAGNSGGALLNMKGQVVGINSIKIADKGVEGMGFAIPISEAKPIIDSLIHNGYVKGRPSLGIEGAPISSIFAKKYNIPQGVLIRKIYKNQSLTTSGIKINDIITKINSVETKTLEDVWTEIDKHAVGDKVHLTIFRYNGGTAGQQSTTFEADVALTEWKPGESQSSQTPKKKNEDGFGFGIR